MATQPKHEQNARVRRRGHEQVGVIVGMRVIRGLALYRVKLDDGSEELYSEAALVPAGNDDRFNGKAK